MRSHQPRSSIVGLAIQSINTTAKVAQEAWELDKAPLVLAGLDRFIH